MWNSTNVSIEPKENLVSTEHINKTNMIMEEESTIVDCSSFIDSPASGNKINRELATLIDYMDQSIIPINAVMTRSKARQLSDIKMPDMLLQIPDISPERFKEMQKTDKGLEKGQHVLDLRSKIQETCELVKKELANSQQRNKIQFDKKSKHRTLTVGSSVLLMRPTMQNALQYKWDGPYTVTKVIGLYDY